VTFICLAQALRRVWLMTTDDPHRMRGVLPDQVRWLHFWARYDPVAAGPLGRRSLPPIELWPDPTAPDPQEALCARLEQCQNVAVVNTDCTFTDHTTYWQNLEQVVGPVARELVAGHPELEQVVQAQLATPDDILVRRLSVAWRAALALAGGIAAGTALFRWDAGPRPCGKNGPTISFCLGDAIRTHGPNLLGDLLHAVAAPVVDFLNGLYMGLQQAGVSVPTWLSQTAPGIPIPDPVARALCTAGASLAVLGIGTLAIGRLFAIPSPVGFPQRSPATKGSAGTLTGLSTLFLVGLAGGELCVAIGIPADNQIASGLFALALLVGVIVSILALVDTIRSRRWGWLPVILTVLLPMLLFLLQIHTATVAPLIDGFAIGPAYRHLGVALTLVAAVGFVVALTHLARRQRWSQFAYQLLPTLILVAIAGALWGQPLILLVFGMLGFSPASYPSLWLIAVGVSVLLAVLSTPIVTILIYGLKGDPTNRGLWPKRVGLRRNVMMLSVLALTSSTIAAYLVVAYPRVDVFLTTTIDIGLGVLGSLAGGLSLADAARHRRWNWILAITVLALSGVLETINWLVLPQQLLTSAPLVLGSIGGALIAPTLCYALWAGPAKDAHQPRAHTALSQPGASP
jgi:hypothetical protein